MLANKSVLGYDVTIVKREDWTNHFPNSKVLPKEYLKNTKFQDEKDVIAVLYPLHCPIPFKKKVPYGSIDNMGNHTIVNTISTMAAQWLNLASSTRSSNTTSHCSRAFHTNALLTHLSPLITRPNHGATLHHLCQPTIRARLF